MPRPAPPSRLLLAALCLILLSSSRAEAVRYKLTQTITSPVAEESFGTAMAEAGGRVFIGSPYEPGTEPRTAPGAVYVYEAATGAFIRRLVSPVAGGSGFGSALAVVGDVLVVGEPSGVTGPGSQRGLVHFFDAASGALIRTVPHPSGNVNRVGFGSTLVPIGDRIAVGAPWTLTYRAPALEAFVLDLGSGDVVQTFQQPPGGAALGFGVALAPVGDMIVAGNPSQRPDFDNAGIAYVYDAASGDFLRTLENPEPFFTSELGTTIVTVGPSVAISAPSGFSVGGPRGAVFVMDPATGALQRTLRSPNPNPYLTFGTSLAAVGDLVLVGAVAGLDLEGSGVFLFDPVTGDVVWDFTTLAATRIGQTVASDGRDLLVRALAGDRGTVFHFVPTCGDGVLDSCETCDDGNNVYGDGCDASCMLETCGNGVVDPGEACDDGNDVDGDGCDRGCLATGCGNCVVTAGEQCDDGNDSREDHCDPNCTVPSCGNGVIGIHETCDDSNTLGGDGCSANCRVEACGNQSVDAGESCDDGNRDAGDGCDAQCHLETPKLDWWQHVFSVPDTTKVGLRGGVVTTPAGILAIVETSFDIVQVQLFDAATGALLHTFPETNVLRTAFIDGDIWILDWSLLAAVRRYDGTTLELRQSYLDPTPGTFGVSFALVGEHVLVQDFKEVDVFDAATGMPAQALAPPAQDDPSQFGAVILSVGQHAVVSAATAAYLFDPSTGALIKTLRGKQDKLVGGEQPVVALGDRVLLSARELNDPAGVVYVFSGDDGRLLHTFEPPGGVPDRDFGRFVAVIGGDVLIAGTNALHIFDAATYALRRTIADPEGYGCFGNSVFDTPFGLAISNLCAGDFVDGIVYVFDRNDEHLLAALPNEHGGDSESHTSVIGAYGTTLLVWHQDDEDGTGAVVRAYRPCADGVLRPGEECDDGNLVSGDGCDLNCTLTRCGNGIVGAGEECDDGNHLAHDGCENDCTRSAAICGDIDVRLEDTRVDLRHVDEPSGDETLTFSAHVVPPAGTTLDVTAAATQGAQVRIVDGRGGPLLDLTASTTLIPPLARGSGCDPRDGWRTTDTRAVYTNASNAIDATCTPGSAQGLRRLEIRRRAKDGGLSFRLRVGPSAIHDPGGGVGSLIAFGSASSAPCGADTVQPLTCESNPRGTMLTCR